MSGWSGGPKQTQVTPRDLGRALAGFKSALGEDLSVARDWFVGNMQRASGGGILNEGETDTSARAGAGMSLAGAAMTGAAPGGVFAAPRGALGAGPIRAYHGSPHDFDRFDMKKIGTGEGAQVYGHGLYFAENEGVARSYRDALGKPAVQVGDKRVVPSPATPEDIALNHLDAAFASQSGAPHAKAMRSLKEAVETARENMPEWRYKQFLEAQAILDDWWRNGAAPTSGGRMYEVAIHADPERFLDWDKPLAQQAAIQPAIGGMIDRIAQLPNRNGPVDRARDAIVRGDASGGDFLNKLEFLYGKPGAFPEIKVRDSAAASSALKDAGVSGVRYFDGQSRAAADGTRNYVAFDDAIVEILRKYGLIPAVSAPMLGAALDQYKPGQAEQ